MIKEVTKKDLKEALDLVNEVFSEFVAVDYSEEGKNTFETYIKNKYEEVSEDILSGHKKMWAYYKNEKILGVISTRDTTHISLMFVEKQNHRKGIARQLFQTVLAEVKRNTGDTQITVNSSPYAVNVYERLGFVKTGERQEKDGIVFIPMKYSPLEQGFLIENEKSNERENTVEHVKPMEQILPLEQEIREELTKRGAGIVRFVDISGLPEEQTQGFQAAVLICMGLSKQYVLDVYNDKPIEQPDDFVDKEHKCDEMADWLAEYLLQKGFRAYSQSEASNDESGFYDEDTLASNLPHKTIALLAGLGFIGKNDLLVTDEFGCAVSICTVLTDAPLKTGQYSVKPSRCGECKACMDACGPGVISGNEWSKEGGREGIVDVFKCEPCGKCMTNCPESLKYARDLEAR